MEWKKRLGLMFLFTRSRLSINKKNQKEEAELKDRKRIEKDLDVFQKTEAKVLTQRFLGKKQRFKFVFL
ncbi:hypothetical protein LQK80_00560 [Bacillus thuringiensis]|nr:hypothetical protein [Bacillus thuringiensis]